MQIVRQTDAQTMAIDNLGGGKNQATSQQVFKVTNFCTDTWFQSFSPLINCIVHHTLLKVNPCRNKTLPQLVHIADWHSIHALLQHVSDAVIYRVEVKTVGWPHCQNWWTGVSHDAEARLCRSKLVHACKGHAEGCLPDIPIVTHQNQFFSETPMPTHNRLFSQPPTFGGTQHYFPWDDKV